MLNSIRKFSKTILAKIILVIIIIPFIFWGMGGVFNSGNVNNIVKINNQNISTQDFINHLNESKINPKIIKENIDNNILEELLAQLVSEKILKKEITELNISISEESLAKIIKKNKNFLDNKKFSRTKYEKFLLSQNLTAASFEQDLKNKELRNLLFFYVSGGIKSPLYITNKSYKDQTGILDINFINLNSNYKKEDNFSLDEINTFINENAENLKNEFIDLSYLKITPKNLVGADDFNQPFYEKIDELENKISNGEDFLTISNELKIKPITRLNYINTGNNEIIENKIYAKRNENKIQLIEDNEFYLLYQINQIKKILPNINDKVFKNKIKKLLYKKNKYSFNKKILDEINSKKFNQINFEKLSNNNIEITKLNSIKDNSKFTTDSVKLLYSLPINEFTLIADEKKNIYIAKIIKLSQKNIDKNSKDFFEYQSQSNIAMRNNVYSSYDLYLNNKYKVTVNDKSLEKVKNLFK
jgi:peptidyl-prolyl cis-trans isomerase D